MIGASAIAQSKMHACGRSYRGGINSAAGTTVEELARENEQLRFQARFRSIYQYYMFLQYPARRECETRL